MVFCLLGIQGPFGAYNLFELESRSNQIIGQLNDVVGKLGNVLDALEEIKTNQQKPKKAGWNDYSFRDVGVIWQAASKEGK